jgi:hypothetical protein
MLAPLVETMFLVMLSAAALADDKPLTAQDLEERGAVEIGRGQLLQEYRAVCLPLLRDPGCGWPKPVYGEFRRLKLKEVEFVCISFRHWACIGSK